MKKREFRKLSGEVRVESVDGGKKIVGYGSVFNQLSEPLRIGNRTMRERVMPGAFDRCLAAGADIRGLVNHNADCVLGRTTSGTMRVSVDAHGLRYEIDPPDTSYARDLMVSLERGDINQSSFGFFTIDDAVVPGDDGYMVRELREVDCFDCSPVTFPAYTGASSGLRAAEELRTMFPDGLPESLTNEPKKKQKRNAECECDCPECEDGDCMNCSDPECDDPNCEGSRSEKPGEIKTKAVDGKNLRASDFAFASDPQDTATWNLPLHDARHVRRALARFNQVRGLSKEEKDAAWKRILSAAKRLKIEVSEENASKLFGASYRDAKETLRAMDPDGDGDDDEPLLESLFDAADACATVGGTARSACWTFWDGNPEYSNPMLRAFADQVKALMSDLNAALAEVEKELAEPTPDLTARKNRYRQLFVDKK